MFTLEQIVTEITLIKNKQLKKSDSAVYQAWEEIADVMCQWCDNLQSFENRSLEKIIMDFASNELIKKSGAYNEIESIRLPTDS